MKHQDVSRAVGEFRLRLAMLYLVKYGLLSLAVWAFLYATVVLVLRGGVGLSRLDVLWGLLSLPVALALAVVLAYRRLPSPTAVRTVLDRHGHCGGLVMAGEETNVGEWNEQIPSVRQPELIYRGERGLALFVGGLAFLLVAFAVPQSLANLGANPLDISKEADRLDEQLNVLEKEKVLEKQRAGELRDQLEQVRRDARGRDPVKTLEALDHLQKTAHNTAQEASEAATRKTEDLARAQTLAEALDRFGAKLDPQQLSDSLKEMARIAEKGELEKELAEAGLDPETLEALKKGELTPEQMKKLAEALKDAKGMQLNKVGKLVKAKLVDASALEKCDKAGKCDCEGLMAFLKENGCKNLADALLLSEEGGKGGVTRGPGHSKLNFGEESTEDGVKFKEEALPPAELQKLKDSSISGISVAKPDVTKEKPGTGTSGALSGSKAGGGSASTQVVLPKHRGAVERYFDRSTPAPPKK